MILVASAHQFPFSALGWISDIPLHYCYLGDVTNILPYLVCCYLTILFLLYLVHRRTYPYSFHSKGCKPFPESRTSKALVLYSKSGPYTLSIGQPRPQISERELLIRNRCVGLNPIDWKCVSYGFGIHELPWISGRECAGEVEEVGAEVKGWKRGDRVWVCSTNYRDNRTSTYQDVSLLISVCDGWRNAPRSLQGHEYHGD